MNERETNPDLGTFEAHESQVRSYVRSFPVVFDRALGHELVATSGKRYIDFFAGAGALNYGHNEPRLKQRLLEYVARDGITHSLDMATRAKGRFIERFRDVILRPRGLDYRFLFPGPTGTNAVETALKLARRATGRQKVYAFRGGFHGMTLGSLSITSNARKREGAGLPLPHARLLPFDGRTGDDGRTSEQVLAAELARDQERESLPAAVVLETVQCEGGVVTAGDEWLRSVAALCKRYGVLLVVDDIQAGCGRTGDFFSFEAAGLEPDIVCLSKSLSGMGLPLALVLVREEYDVLRPGEHNGTFRGHNLAFVTAAEALCYWENESFGLEIKAKASILRGALHALQRRFSDVVAEVRGRGLVQGLRMSLPGLAAAVSALAFERGLIIETAGPEDEVLKFLPPLTIDSRALEEGLSIVESAMSDALAELAVAGGVAR